MGERGPIPKRSDERLGNPTHAADVDPVEKVFVGDQPVSIPPVCEHWCDTARDWYVSLQDSATLRFMEPSDWAAARFVCEIMGQAFDCEKPNAQLIGVIWRAMTDMLSTEGARRRVRIEIERSAAPAEPEGVTALADYLSVA